MNNPVWINDKGKIVEPEYCRIFCPGIQCAVSTNAFILWMGPLPDESKLKRTIYEEISPWLHAKVAQTVKQVIKALKLAAYADLCPCNVTASMWRTALIFWTVYLQRKKSIAATAYRCLIGQMLLQPQHWLRFLSELLEPEMFPLCKSIWAIV